jgi:hypothetical protein
MRFLFAPLCNERGNLMGAAMMTGAAMVIALGMYKYSESVSSTRQGAANESYARLNNDVVTSRLGHAVGSNAIMCSEVEKKCYWNSKFKPEDFGLESVSQSGDMLQVKAKNCLPSSTESVDLTNCKDVYAEADVRFVNFNDLQQAKLVSGLMKSGDKDHFGALVATKTEFATANNAKKAVTTSSLIRRPRAILRVIAGQAVCSNTCQVPLGTKGNMTNNWCFGPVEVENGRSNTSIKVAVVNDGPGHVYRFRLRRSYTAVGNFVGNEAVPDADVFDSVKVVPKGIAPGEKYEFIDDKVPCFDEKVTVNITQVGAVAGTTSTTTEDARNSRPSGTASYHFINDSIEPNNALVLSGDGTTVPATLTTTTVVTTVVPVVRSGMN